MQRTFQYHEHLSLRAKVLVRAKFDFSILNEIYKCYVQQWGISLVCGDKPIALVIQDLLTGTTWLMTQLDVTNSRELEISLDRRRC